MRNLRINSFQWGKNPQIKKVIEAQEAFLKKLGKFD